MIAQPRQGDGRLQVFGLLKVAPAFCADGVALGLIEMGDRGVRPSQRGIAQQGDEAVTHDIGLFRKTAQVGEGGEQIDEANGSVAHRASVCLRVNLARPVLRAHLRHAARRKAPTRRARALGSSWFLARRFDRDQARMRSMT